MGSSCSLKLESNLNVKIKVKFNQLQTFKIYNLGTKFLIINIYIYRERERASEQNSVVMG